jgi:hypothetical protein
MSQRVTETTNPATADFGMRTFDVVLNDNHVVEIAVSQRVREDCPSEIHGSDELLISNQVIRNADFSAAVELLAPVLNATPKAQSLS